MDKKELAKKCQEIMLVTKGTPYDYVSALCEMSNLIIDYAEACEDRIAELEEENKNLKLCRCCECKSENEYMLQGLIRDLEEENAKLLKQKHKNIWRK